MKFVPCNSDLCTKDGTHCAGCGRSHEEIAETITPNEKENIPDPKIVEKSKSIYKFPSQAEINANYSTFRGPGGNGTAYQKNIPIKWDGETGENILYPVNYGAYPTITHRCGQPLTVC